MIHVNTASGHSLLSREEFEKQFGRLPSASGPHIEEGRRLAAARDAADLSMGELAKAVTGWTRLTVSDIEHGRTQITPMIRAAYQKTISAKKVGAR
jgi:DNA-binding XRE family transcriptional regulator